MAPAPDRRRPRVHPLTLVALLVACGAPPAPTGADPDPNATAAAPESTQASDAPAGTLGVYIVVDQLPMGLFRAAQPQFRGGLARLTGPDSYTGVARHAHAATYTCPGHATLSTGASPAVHGIVGNGWIADGKAQYCGDIELLLADTLADRVVAQGGRVASLSHKDRGAIMMAGRSAAASVWWDKKKGGFRGTPWAERLDWRSTASQWVPRSPDALAAHAADAQAHEGHSLDRTTFPYPPQDDPRKFLYTPSAGQAMVDLADLAVANLDLGGGARRDLLTISFSHTDYVGHNFGPDSWEAVDALVRLDEQLGELFTALDERLEGRWFAVLSSDHGAPPAGNIRRLDEDAMIATAKAALQAAGHASQITYADPTFYLAEDTADRQAAAVVLADAVGTIEGLSAVAWKTGAQAPASVSDAVHADRSGEVFVLPDEGWVFAHKKAPTTGTQHGTPHDYDAQVPLLAVGAGVNPGRAAAELDTRQIAPTVAALLGVPEPTDAQLEGVAEVIR